MCARPNGAFGAVNCSSAVTSFQDPRQSIVFCLAFLLLPTGQRQQGTRSEEDEDRGGSRALVETVVRAGLSPRKSYGDGL